MSFDAAEGGGKAALLHYAVHAPDGSFPMHISDPQSPVGTQVKVPEGTLRIAPFVQKPKVTNERQQQCLVEGCYTLCVRDTAGTHVGDFEINPWGALVYKAGTTKRPAIVARAGTPTRTVYFVYDEKVSGGRGPLRFALEYKREQYVNERKLHGSDGWDYNFASPDGVVSVYPASAVRLLFEKLSVEADAANKKALAELEEWANSRSSNGLYTGIPGASTQSSVPGSGGGYCTGGG